MSKKAKCMADGGIVGADGMTDAQRAKRNAALQSLGMSTAQPPVQAPPAMPQTVQVTTPAEPDRPRGIMGILGNRGKQIDKAAGYAAGGIVRGKGGIDNVPMSVGGVNVNLTGGKKPEAVLPGKTVEALGGPGAVEALIEATNGKPPVRSGLREGGEYKDGALYTNINEEDEYTRAMKERQGITGQMFPNAAAVWNESGKDVGAAMQKGNYANALGNAVRGTLATGVGVVDDVIGNPIRNIAPAVKDFGSGLVGDASVAPKATNSQTATNPLALGAQSVTDLAAKPTGAQFITGAKPGEMPSSAQGGFTQGGKSYNVNDTSQQGIARVTAPGTLPLYTNIAPEQAVSGLKNQPVSGNAASVQEGLDRYARANKIRGEMIDSMANANGTAMSGSALAPGELAPGVTLQNLKDAQWNDSVGTNRGETNALLGAIAAYRGNAANDTARYGHDVAAQRAAGHDQVLMRGQDINALGDKARLGILQTNADRDNRLTGLKTSLTEGEIADQKMVRDARTALIAALASGDPKAIEAAKANAVATGIKFDRPDNQIDFKASQAGNAVTQKNADGSMTVTPIGINGKPGTPYTVGGQQQGQMNSGADKIKAEMQAGRISRDEAIKQLKAMGYQ